MVILGRSGGADKGSSQGRRAASLPGVRNRIPGRPPTGAGQPPGPVEPRAGLPGARCFVEDLARASWRSLAASVRIVRQDSPAKPGRWRGGWRANVLIRQGLAPRQPTRQAPRRPGPGHGRAYVAAVLPTGSSRPCGVSARPADWRRLLIFLELESRKRTEVPKRRTPGDRRRASSIGEELVPMGESVPLSRRDGLRRPPGASMRRRSPSGSTPTSAGLSPLPCGRR